MHRCLLWAMSCVLPQLHLLQLAHISHPADVMGVSLLERAFQNMGECWHGVGGDERKSPTPNSAHIGNEVVCTPCERFLQHRASRVAMLTNSLQQHFSAGLLIPSEYWLTSCCNQTSLALVLSPLLTHCKRLQGNLDLSECFL